MVQNFQEYNIISIASKNNDRSENISSFVQTHQNPQNNHTMEIGTDVEIVAEATKRNGTYSHNLQKYIWIVKGGVHVKLLFSCIDEFIQPSCKMHKNLDVLLQVTPRK